MRIITVANQKGGCGKTTVVINLAACLAREGQRTLAVDLDPQGHCALGLAVPEEQIEVSIADVLLANPVEQPPDLSRVIWQISSNYDLIPSRLDLCALEQRLAGVPDRETRLRAALDTVADKYDLILVDTPPTVGFLTQSALYAADEVVVPVDTGYFSLHGLSKQLDTIREVRAAYGRPVTVRILANLYDVRTKLGREILAELRKRHGDAMFTSFINFNTKLKESCSLGQPITEYDPASSGCRDLVRLAREVVSLGAAKPVMAPTGVAARAGVTAPTRTTVPAGALPPVEAATSARSTRVEESLLRQADALAADAEKLLATSQTLLGPGRPIPVVQLPPTPQETARKIEMIYGPQPTGDGMVFTVQVAGASRVQLAGDFNDWNPDLAPMRRMREDAYQIRLPLTPGRYQYRYVIDGRWRRDPANDRVEENPYGELNSVVEVV
ncbi:MAG: AAA family ATPase [Phycisphaerae bacterium]|nr:AAA family ATPase [Phycisphaerae bacterium]